VGSDCGWNQARNSSIGCNTTVAWSPPQPALQDRVGFRRGVVVAFSIMDKTTTAWETQHLGIRKFVGQSETMEAFGMERDFNSLMQWCYKAAQAMLDGDSTNAMILVSMFKEMYSKHGMKTILGHCLGHHLVNVMKELVKMAGGTSAKHSGKAAHKKIIFGTCDGMKKVFPQESGQGQRLPLVQRELGCNSGWHVQKPDQVQSSRQAGDHSEKDQEDDLGAGETVVPTDSVHRIRASDPRGDLRR